MTAYQPVWRNGRELQAGERDCADRYSMIRPALDRLDGPFTVLDVGANLGYFSTRICEDYPATALAVDPRPELTASSKVTVAHDVLDAHGLRRLPRHDVILALSVVHHMPDWRSALDALQACRAFAIVEVPHPDEDWMRHAAARDELGPLHDEVKFRAAATLGTAVRAGRDGTSYARPLYLLPGRLQAWEGQVFTGSGTNSRVMPSYSDGLDTSLGYQPVPGSLNLKGVPINLGAPVIDWVGRDGTRIRDYQLWPAWIDGETHCHAMTPGARGHGPGCLELIAPHRLRDTWRLVDGDTITLDIETGP